MTSVPVKNVRGEVVGDIDLDDRVFGIKPNKAVVHQAMVAQLANQRKGTADTKTRGEVRGGTHKMWRQKGTGRARQGDRRAPHWTGGGVVFGPHPRSYHLDVPRKMRRLAMMSALSARVADQELTILDELSLAAARTREVAGVISALGLKRGALIVVPERDESLARASRNLPEVRTVTPGGLNLLDVLKYRHLILTRSAAEALTRQLTTEIGRGKGAAEADESAEAPAEKPKRASRAKAGTSTTTGQDGGPTIEMEEAAVAKAEAGSSPDVALADAAEDVASADEAPTTQATVLKDTDSEAADASEAGEGSPDKKEQA